MRRRPSPARLRRSVVVWGALAGAALAPAERAAWGGDAAHYAVHGELGCEFDSNVHRSEIVEGVEDFPLVSSPAARGVVGLNLSDAVGDRQQVTVSAVGAGKLFTDAAARSEDVAIAQTSAAWRLALGDRTAATLQGAYYEAFQRPAGDPELAALRRDFRSLAPALRVARVIAPRLEAAAAAGYRLFVYKPDESYDFDAPFGALDLRWARESDDGGADWEVAAGAGLELRAFEGRTLVDACVPPSSVGAGCLPTPGTSRRRDNFVTSQIEVTRTGAVLLGVGYALHWNSSNSFGETVMRHFGTLRLTAPLPFGVYLAARAELLIARYLHPVFVGQLQSGGLTYASIEDENRSSLRVDLSRALTDRLQLVARYTIYVNELGVSSAVARYRRQTALLSLAFTLEK
jgi:hypothetical protein